MATAAKDGRRKRSGRRKGKAPKSKPADELAADAAKKGAKGTHLPAAKQALRDTLMITRQAQGWTTAEIAAEAGLTVRGARAAIERRRASLPDLVEMDPENIIRSLIEQFQTAIGDYERIAVHHIERNPSAAIGAKNGAQAARRDLKDLLQATGILPHELGTMRHLVDLRVTVNVLIESVQKFELVVKEAKLPKANREPIVTAAAELKTNLRELAGLDGSEVNALPSGASPS